MIGSGLSTSRDRGGWSTDIPSDSTVQDYGGNTGSNRGPGGFLPVGVHMGILEEKGVETVEALAMAAVWWRQEAESYKRNWEGWWQLSAKLAKREG